MPDRLRETLSKTLAGYVAARGTERIGKSSPMWQQLTQVGPWLASTDLLRAHGRIAVKVSAGQGAWARIPWIACLHQDVTTTTRDGVYVIYLFRADMSGVYLTLNQGVTRPIERLGKIGGLAAVTERAAKLRGRLGELADAGFELGEPIDLRSDYVLAQQYTASTIAHKLYEGGRVPADAVLLGDLRVALEAYEGLVG
jgi:hypothetical protein